MKFENGLREPLAAGLCFQTNGQPVDVFKRTLPRLYGQFRRKYGPGPPLPLYFGYEPGIVVIHGDVIGHWFIDKSLLARRLKPLPGAALTSEPVPQEKSDRVAVDPNLSQSTNSTVRSKP